MKRVLPIVLVATALVACGSNGGGGSARLRLPRLLRKRARFVLKRSWSLVTCLWAAPR